MKGYKIILLVFLFSGMSQILLAQAITGTWQKDSEIVGAGYGEIYRFHKEGKFEFNLPQCSDLNTIISFEGTYEIKNDKIYFIITSRKEMSEYKIVQGNPGFEDNWIIEGGEIKEVKQDTTKTYWFDFSSKKEGNQSIIEIGNTTYYKIRKEDK